MEMKNPILGLQAPRKGTIGTRIALFATFQGVLRIIVGPKSSQTNIGMLNITKGA
jgi:hypothetical protein